MALLDYGWLYALHARSSIERGRVWQAEYMISLIRDQVIAAACVRHRLPAREGRGVDRLPPKEKQRFQGAPVPSLPIPEVRRAVGAAHPRLVADGLPLPSAP